MSWARNPDAGGVKIKEDVKQRTKKRILEYAAEHYEGKYTRLEVRFRGQFCYVDAYVEPSVSEDWPVSDWGESRDEHVEHLRNTPTHLFRLRFLGDENRWAFAFFAYSSETYELSILPNGDFFGTPEDALDAASCYFA